MNDLQEYFENNEHGDMIYKWTHSFEVYERHLSRFRGTDVGILEIGVAEGGSLKMWADYFGSDAKVYGIDIKPECKQADNKQIKVFIGSQTDKYFLYDVASHIPKIDIVIDDGGHHMDQMRCSFEVFYPLISPDGVYVCEDTFLCYHEGHGGGYLSENSFIEYSKNFIDYLHKWKYKWDPEKVGTVYPIEFRDQTWSVHFYPNIMLVEKRAMSMPVSKKKGDMRTECPDSWSIETMDGLRRPYS